jgi:hypothetical protein
VQQHLQAAHDARALRGGRRGEGGGPRRVDDVEDDRRAGGEGVGRPGGQRRDDDVGVGEGRLGAGRVGEGVVDRGGDAEPPRRGAQLARPRRARPPGGR